MKTKVLHCLGWLSIKANSFLSLVFVKEVRYLLCMMVVIFATSMYLSDWDLPLAFIYLFDPGKASESWKTMAVFFATWLVGGGILVSVMVTQYYRIVGGYFRRWRKLVRNHVVVLGWDDGMMMELNKVLSNEREPVECYVITRKDVPALMKSFKSVGLENMVVYKGDYDNEIEWRKNLRVEEARQVFIAGESGEEAHDARVVLLYEKLRCVVKNVPIKVNIQDFGLAKKLIAKGKDVFGNFHLNWANFLWRRLDLPSGMDKLELYIVGFGAMGKAVALTVPDDRTANVKIYITDDDADKLSEEKSRYDMQFAESNPVCIEEWGSALESMHDRIDNGTGTVRVIVVAKKRSEKGLLCMMDIVSKFSDHVPRNLKLALSQEIEGIDVDPASAKMDIGPAEVVLFGMKKGCLNEAHSDT